MTADAGRVVKNTGDDSCCPSWTPVERDGDLLGSAVNLAARVCSHAGPGQILASGVLRELCQAPALAGPFHERGRVAMKGFVNAVQLYEVGWTVGAASAASAQPAEPML